MKRSGINEKIVCRNKFFPYVNSYTRTAKIEAKVVYPIKARNGREPDLFIKKKAKFNIAMADMTIGL